MAPVYDKGATQAHLIDAFGRAKRGTQARVAERSGVSSATVHKWAAGQVCPEPDKWPAIEAELGLPDGELALVSGYRESKGERPQFAASLNTSEIVTRLDRVESLLHQLLNENDDEPVAPRRRPSSPSE